MMLKDTCPECGYEGFVIDYERGEVVCPRCGLVIDDNLLVEYSEFEEFDNQKTDKYTIMEDSITYTLHDKGLTTIIDNKNKDINGNNIPLRNNAQWHRLRKWDRRNKISGSAERNLSYALDKLTRDASRMRLPKDVNETASLVYRGALEYDLIKGRGIDAVVAASLYITCRRFNIPRTLNEIEEVSGVSKKKLGRTYRFLCRQLNIKLPLPSPVDYVPRFASELGLSGEAQSKAIDIIEKAMRRELTSGKQPNIIACAALYIVSPLFDEKITMADVANVAKVSENTIGNTCRILDGLLD